MVEEFKDFLKGCSHFVAGKASTAPNHMYILRQLWEKDPMLFFCVPFIPPKDWTRLGPVGHALVELAERFRYVAFSPYRVTGTKAYGELVIAVGPGKEDKIEFKDVDSLLVNGMCEEVVRQARNSIDKKLVRYAFPPDEED